MKLILPFLIVGIALFQEIVDQIFFGGDWNFLVGGGNSWWSLLCAPFSHGGFARFGWVKR